MLDDRELILNVKLNKSDHSDVQKLRRHHDGDRLQRRVPIVSRTRTRSRSRTRTYFHFRSKRFLHYFRISQTVDFLKNALSQISLKTNR